MSEPAVRRALPGDAEAVTGLIERAIRISTAGAYPADAVEAWATGRTAEAVRAMIEVTDGFVATLGEAVVGWANLDGDEVDQLYVDPDAGGQGVARRLYETIEALARANRLDQLTSVASLRAEPAFHHFGFREVDTDQVAFNGRTFTVVRMAKHLERALPGQAAVRRDGRGRDVAGPDHNQAGRR
ncbi:MAG: GNAT family N-acetyltransferase [Actinomycetota bacterium]|nr:GNAT family N-acetyltransferase [Actinomycetota bacterium]